MARSAAAGPSVIVSPLLLAIGIGLALAGAALLAGAVALAWLAQRRADATGAAGPDGSGPSITLAPRSAGAMGTSEGPRTSLQLDR